MIHIFNISNITFFKITCQRFIELAELIVALFTKENRHTYYSPYVRVNKYRTGPTGTLYEHYRYIKTVLRKGGILTSATRTDNLLYEPFGEYEM